MKIKTAKLTGAALDWAVAKCEGEALVDGCLFTKDPDAEQILYTPSTDWAQGGPIIEREGISVIRLHHDWEATLDLDEGDAMIEVRTGPTPLIAAMRCYVASRLGDEVGIPDELTR